MTRIDPPRPADLRPLLQARSLAIVGISRPERFGGQLFINLQKAGFPGPIFAVNPRYQSLYDRPCYPSLETLPKRPDCALLAVPNHRLLDTLEQAASLGIPAAVIFANAAGLAGTRSLEDVLAETAQRARMAVCGPNCMGFLALGQRLAVSGYPVIDEMPAGGISLISHSGSVFESLVQNNRRIHFNYAISSGNEMVTTIADYMHFLLDDPATRVLALFLETVRDPRNFRSALAKAAERGIPVVALKVGRSARGASLAMAHSGALAGEDPAYEAIFDRYGVRRMTSLDEMHDTLELFSRSTRLRPAAVSAILDSGGERAMLVDLAEAQNVPFADLQPATRSRIESVLEPGLSPGNPLDAWGTGNSSDTIYRTCALAMDADPNSGLTVFAVDMMRASTMPPTYPQIVLPILEQFRKPLVFLANVTAAAGEDQLEELRRAGVPVLMGTETGLRAIQHLLSYSRYQDDYAALWAHERPAAPANLDTLKARLREAETPLGETDALPFLSAYGIPTIPTCPAHDLATALQAAETLGYPVALKTAAGISHKSDRGGVALDLRSAAELDTAYEDMRARLGPQVVIQPMAPPGVELLMGLVHDPQFGPLLSIAAGGIFVELLGDQRLHALPTNSLRARREILSLRAAALLQGARGRPPADLQALVGAFLGLAAMAEDLGDLIQELDINPLIAGPDGVVAVDALIVPRKASEAAAVF